MRPRLESITLRGYKTIHELKDFAPGPLTVLIGPNGAGKSNFISFFRMLSWMLAPPGGLQEYVARQGGASRLLHEGPQRTRDIEADLRIATEFGSVEYSFTLAWAPGDTLFFADESYGKPPVRRSPHPGHLEPALIGWAESGDPTARAILSLFEGMVPYHFQNTSDTARIRQKWETGDNRYLKEDAGNLGPFLLSLRGKKPEYYKRIVDTIRQTHPFFADFQLRSEDGAVLLRWREKGSDREFHAGQAADGMLRMMALIALLQQPTGRMRDVLILDEPELGLHPFAVEVIADLIRAASKELQVIVASQSVSLIDRFAPDEIVVVDREHSESKFRRLDADNLKSWLEEYSVSELWEKNVIGGRPSR